MSAQNRRLVNQTLKTVMQSESKDTVDTFIRRFKSMQAFDPFNSIPKMLKYVQDLVKIINK